MILLVASLCWLTYASDILIDSYSETNYDNYSGLYAVNYAWGQTFNISAGINYKITSCKFYLQKVGSPTGHLRAALYAESGGKPTGSMLADSDDYDVSTIPTSFTLIEFIFSVGYTITPDVDWCILVYWHDMTSSYPPNYVQVGQDGSSPSHHGTGFYSTDMSSWSTSARDIIFYVYGVIPPPPPPTVYGYINKIELQQWNTTLDDWQDMEGHPVFADEYSNTTGFQFDPEPNWKVRFFVIVELNDTLASSTAEAAIFTRVLLTVQRQDERGVALDWVYNATALNLIDSSGPSGGFYTVRYYLDWVNDKPNGGFWYEVWLDYEVYY